MYIILHKNKYTKCVIKINKLFKMERIESSYFWKIVLKKGSLLAKKGTWKIQKGRSRSNLHNSKFLLTLQFKLRKIFKKKKKLFNKAWGSRVLYDSEISSARSFCLAVLICVL